MLTPAPIDKNVTPYTKRPVFKHNAGLFVEGKSSKSYHAASRVVPQDCRVDGCLGGFECCSDGYCKGRCPQPADRPFWR